MSPSRFLVISAVASTLVACAARPQIRQEVEALPPLDPAYARLVIGAGSIGGVKLWSVKQVGPVYLDGQQIGTTAKDEHFVVDIKPGTYEATCKPFEPEKNFVEKRALTFSAGATSYLVCTQETKGLGPAFGLIGALVSEYLTSTFLEPGVIDTKSSRLVSYTKRL